MTVVPARARPGAWPGPRGVLLAIAISAAAGFCAQIVAWPLAVASACALLAVLFVADARAGAAAFALQRIAPERFTLARRGVLRYVVENRGAAALRFAIVEAPVAKLALADDARGEVAPRAHVTVEIPFVPRERGRTALVASYAWYETQAGLVRHRVRLDGPQAIRVLPELAPDETSDLALRARLIDAGLRRLRRRGAGTEFESLREYTPDDAFRDVDWHATARRGRIMVAQHEVERSQQVLVAVDAGRLMAARLGDRRKLDYAVDAAVGVSALARRAGDRVGIHAFAGRTLAAVAPAAGAAHAAALVEALADLEPQAEESDYERAALDLRRAARKRSLIVVLTDFFDPPASAAMLSALAVLVRHHVVLVALMNDAALTVALTAEIRSPGDAYRAAVATALAAQRAGAIAAFRARGMIVVDVPARDLRLALLDAYLDVKTRGRL